MELLEVFNEQEILNTHFRMFGDKNNPFFLAKDVAEWIGHSNSRMMLQYVDEEEKVVRSAYTHGGVQEQCFLTEQGLYEVLMQSRKPIAKQFKKEIKQILKQIRQTGGVVINGREDEFIKNYFPSFSDEVKLAMTLDLKKQNEKYRIQIEEQKPKVEFANTVLKSNDNILVRQLAKMICDEGIEIGEKRLYAKLREWGMIFKNSTEPYQKYIKDGTFVVQECPIDLGTHVKIKGTTKVTPAGQIRIIEKLKKENEQLKGE